MTKINDILEALSYQGKKLGHRPAIILDLRKGSTLIVSPLPESYKACGCHISETLTDDFCPLCGTSSINLKNWNVSYTLYNILYKLIDILSNVGYKSITIVGYEILPTNFVGDLSNFKYHYIEPLPHRRTIIHISNDIVHSEDLFVKSGETVLTPDKMTFISIFSDSKNVLDIYRKKIIHGSRLDPIEYTNFLLSNAGYSDIKCFTTGELDV